MSGVKGCTNSKCVAVKKKITYKETEDFCSKCGGPLTYVCKKCYTPIEKKEKLCARHQAEKKDKADKVMKTAAQAGGAVLSVGAVIYARRRIGKSTLIAEFVPNYSNKDKAICYGITEK